MNHAAESVRRKIAERLMGLLEKDRPRNLLRFEYYAAPGNRSQNFCFVDGARLHVEKVLRKDDQIGEFARFQRTFCFFSEPGVSGPQGVAANRIGDRETLGWHKSSLGQAFGGLPCDGGLDSFERVERDHRPIAAESDLSATIRNAFPNPGARSAIWTCVARPHAQRVFVGVGMQGLHAGDDAQSSEARNVVRGDRFNVLDAWTLA